MRPLTKVIVTDQIPNVVGIIRQVSTWSEVNGGSNTNVCYLIESLRWDGPRWISAMHVKEANETNGT